MFFTRYKGICQDAEPVSKDFILKATVTSMSEIESPTDGRKMCIIDLYSEEPVMLNGETGHIFRVHIPNYDTGPRFSLNRMKFWLCYGHREPVMLNEQEDLVVPLLDAEDFDYFTGMTLYFHGQVVKFSNGREIVEIGYSAKD